MNLSYNLCGIISTKQYDTKVIAHNKYDIS